MLVILKNIKNLGVCGYAPIWLYTFIYNMERTTTQDKTPGVCGHASVLLEIIIHDMERAITQVKNSGACRQAPVLLRAAGKALGTIRPYA